MDDRFEDDDREALAAMSAGPPPRKGHSYSQQLRNVGGKRGQIRKHSLDEDRIPQNMEYYNNNHHEYSGNDSYHHHYSDDMAHRLDHSISLTGGDPAGEGSDQQRQPLPEFIAAGGVGIFRAPIRAAVHPHRPPALELRPHPLRETQVGRFLRTIGCTETQLWAGQECGVRFWYLRDMFEPGTGLSGRVRRGDEDAAPFFESGNTAPALCLLVDEGNRLVWTGHKDGKIRSWKMEPNANSSSDDSSSL